MFRLRHSLLVLPLLALMLSAIPAHADMTIADAQLTPVLSGPVQSLDGIGYMCTPDISSPSIIIRYWEPGYHPAGSKDDTDLPVDQTEPQTVIADGLPHTYNKDERSSHFHLLVCSSISTRPSVLLRVSP